MMRWEAADDNRSDTIVMIQRILDRKGLQRLVAPLTEAFCLLAAAFASGRRHTAAKRGWPDFVCFERKLPMCMQNYWLCWHEKLRLNALLGFLQALRFSQSCSCVSFLLLLPPICLPKCRWAASCAPEGRCTTFRSSKLFKIFTTCAKCIHLFLSLLMIYLQQSRKSMSKPYMCLFVCWGSFSESHLLECECNSTPYTGSSRKLSRLVTWLRIPRTTPVPLDVISHSGQAKRLWQKWACNKRRWWRNTALTSYFDPLYLFIFWGGEVGDFCCKHWHMCLSFVNSKLTTFEIGKCRTSLFMLLSWTISKRGSEAFVWSWNWKDLWTIWIYMWHWMYDVTDVWSSMLQLATACLLDTY